MFWQKNYVLLLQKNDSLETKKQESIDKFAHRIELASKAIVQGAILKGDFGTEDIGKLLDIVMKSMEEFQRIAQEDDIEWD